MWFHHKEIPPWIHLLLTSMLHTCRCPKGEHSTLHVKCQPDSCSRLTASCCCFSWQILIGKMGTANPFKPLCLVKKQHTETNVMSSPVPTIKKDKQKVTTWSQPFTNIGYRQRRPKRKKITTPAVFKTQPGPSLLFSLPGPCLIRRSINQVIYKMP